VLPSPTLARRADTRLRLLTAVLGLTLVYLLVLALGDARAGTGSDAGGKLATARVLAEDGGLSPDVGYWAEDLDPEGRHHPLVNTERRAEHWVQATSVPYSLVTGRLWAIGGAAAVGALSMAGAVAAALAARRLAARLGGGAGWTAFWLVGLASPLALYATDAWEHAPAVGLALWGLVLALEAETPARAAAAGALLGGALLLRAEVGAYVVAFAVASLAVAEVRQRWTRRPALLAAGGLAAGALLLANGVLERAALGAGVRSDRAAVGAGQAGHELGQRVTDALLTGFGLFPDPSAGALAAGVVLLAALVVLAARVAGAAWASDRLVRASAVLAVALYAVRLLDGWGFVPGALAAAPIVVLAAAAPRRAETRVVLGTALGAVPLVWLGQWTGNHVAQWGGRYLLLTTVLLLTVASLVLTRERMREAPVAAVAGLGAVVALGGLAWHVERTNVVGQAGAELAGLPDEVVVVSSEPHLGRELGTWYGDRRWLSGSEGLDVAVAAEPDEVAVIDRQFGGEPRPAVIEVPGYELVEERPVDYLGSTLLVRVHARR
jgi:hypothetical protein